MCNAGAQNLRCVQKGHIFGFSVSSSGGVEVAHFTEADTQFRILKQVAPLELE